MKKIYTISDIHGHYKETIEALNNSGYNSEDENSVLVVCGDLFDRGTESVEIYRYLKDLTDRNKAIVIRGNHDDFFIDMLNGKNCYFNFLHNGLDRTIDSFLNQTDSWYLFNRTCSNAPDIAKKTYGDRVEYILRDTFSVPIEVRFEIYQEYVVEYIKKNYEGLLEWLISLPYYYETNNYIFTHGAIDCRCKDWRKPEYSKYPYWSPWQCLTWDDGSFFGKDIINTDKKVIVGHYGTDDIRYKYNLPIDEPNSYKILESEDGRKIYIDTCTVLTKRVNVLVIIDNLLEEGIEYEKSY